MCWLPLWTVQGGAGSGEGHRSLLNQHSSPNAFNVRSDMAQRYSYFRPNCSAMY
jgi:hypothetical protein